MPILTDITAPNGAKCRVHQVIHMETNLAQTPTGILVRVASYAEEANALAETPVFHWSPVLVPFTVLDVADMLGSAERALTAMADSPFAGGSQIGPVTDLVKAKARRWSEVKQLRSAREFGPLVWDGSTFDADAAAQLRIMGAVQLAAQAAAAGQPFAMDWTLADNTIRTLSAADLRALGEALGQQVAAAHEIARILREEIEAAETVEAVQAVDWPIAD